MAQLFETTTINGMKLKNRCVRSATWEGLATSDGYVTPELTKLMLSLVEGEAGLIISGHAYVSREGQAGRQQLGVYDDRLVPGLSEMVKAVHEGGGTIVMQLAHAGCHAATDRTGLEAVGPSSMGLSGKGPCREASQEEIAGIIRAFQEGARRARESGFDGVQLHGAHGYLLSQFLSPHYNKRRDGYGGTLENRARMVMETYRAVRSAVSADYPVLIKLNSQDFLADGFSEDEMIRVASMLQDEGIDAIELSGGTILSDQAHLPVRKAKLDTPEKEVFYEHSARRFKKELKVPLMVVGGIRSYEVAERLVAEKIADYISLCRPLIREPHLVKRWKSGDLEPAKCLRDNLCFRPALKGLGIRCVVDEKMNQGEGALKTEG